MDMQTFIANTIIKVYDTQGLAAAQEKYRQYFIYQPTYARYKTGVDNILTTTDNPNTGTDYSDAIVTA